FEPNTTTAAVRTPASELRRYRASSRRSASDRRGRARALEPCSSPGREPVGNHGGYEQGRSPRGAILFRGGPAAGAVCVAYAGAGRGRTFAARAAAATALGPARTPRALADQGARTHADRRAERARSLAGASGVNQPLAD